MVSTRQMSTTQSGAEAEESCARLAVVTRQANNSLSSLAPGKAASTASGSGSSPKQFNDPVQPQQSVFLLDLPIEILDKIFCHVGYKKVGQLRVVSPQMDQICSAILNSTFSKLQTQMLNRFQTVKAKMPRRESARRNHPLACECDIIETCYMRLSLLQMTFGKHIERKHCCFFPGGILDEVYNVLNYIRTTPKLDRPYKVTDELFDLSTMAMEYFKEHIEPTLPQIAYFSKGFFDLPSKSKTPFSLKAKSEIVDNSSNLPAPPQSNMVLRKGIRKIKQGMKMYNNQLTVLRSELRTCKKKSSEQGKQIAEQQKLLAEQQKQTLEYANRLDENDKKNEEMSRKFSTLLQELNKCKTELQYWRSKSPATQICTSCGSKIAPVAPEDFQTLVNQGVKPEDINITVDDVDESLGSDSIALSSTLESQFDGEKFLLPTNPITKATQSSTTGNSSSLKRRYEETLTSPTNFTSIGPGSDSLAIDSVTVENTGDDRNKNIIIPPGNDTASNTQGAGDVQPNATFTGPSTSLCTSNDFDSPQNVNSDTKKARRVQNKGSRCQNLSRTASNKCIYINNNKKN